MIHPSLSEVYLQRMNDLIDNREVVVEQGNGYITFTAPVVRFNEPDAFGEFFTADTVFSPMVNRDLGPVTVFESKEDWTARMIERLEKMGLV